MSRRLRRVAWIAALFALAAALGFASASRIAPERLRSEIEARLGTSLGVPVTLGRVHLGLGWGLRVAASDVRLGPDEAGAEVRARRAVAWVAPFALLAGRVEVRALRFDGARLPFRRDADHRWHLGPLPPFGAIRHPGESGHPEELLSPLIALEHALRGLLARPLLAGTLELRGAHIDLGGERGLALDPVSLRIAHRSGTATGRLRARLVGPAGPGGTVEGEGRRDGDGAVRMVLAATELDLASFEPPLRAALPEARLAGVLSGAATFESPGLGDGRLELDLVGRDLEAAAPGDDGFGPVSLARAEARLTLEIGPEQLRVEAERIASGPFALALEGTIERPATQESTTSLALRFRDLGIARIRELLGGLPPQARERFLDLLAPVGFGQIASLEASATAPLARWRALLSGHTDPLPADLRLEAVLAEVAVRIDEEDSLESLSGRFAWEGDRITLREVEGELGGSPLPALDLTLDGVSHLFAADPARRRMRSDAPPLRGLPVLWSAARPEHPEPGAAGPEVTLELDSLEHPMFVWPLAGLRASVRPAEHGVDIAVARATWAGVPVRGRARWQFQPDERFEARLRAGAPADADEAPPGEGAWARGRFHVGPFERDAWRQLAARGEFAALGDKTELWDVEIALAPGGSLAAEGQLELGREDAVPFSASLSLTDADLPALLGLIGQPGGATGTVDLSGTLHGVLGPDGLRLRELLGGLEVRARDGAFRRTIPPLAAIALASESFNPFARRDQIRYDRAEAQLAFGSGRMRAESFAVDGPDVRIFASGAVDVAEAPHEVDAQIALYLFRQIDRAIGMIPVVSPLLLGSDDSLVAAYFELEGPWQKPRASLVPLRTLAKGPGSIVLENVPHFVRSGWDVLRGMLGAANGNTAGGAREEEGG